MTKKEVKKEYYNEDYYFNGSSPVFRGGYNNYLNFQKKHPYDWVISLFKYANGHKILDVGGALGIFLARLPDFYEKTCLDVSEYAIRFGKGAYKDIKFVNSTIADFKTSEKFDIVTAFDVMEHVKNLEGSLNKIYDLLNDDGIFILAVPIASKLHHFFASFGVSLLNCDISHVTLTTEKSWKEYVLDEKWEIVYDKKLTIFNHYIPPLHIHHVFVLKKRKIKNKVNKVG